MSAPADSTSRFQVGLNGYQTVCAGCFAPYPYAQPLDQRFGSVNEFRTDATSNYNGLQTSLTEQFHSLTLNANYTLQSLPRRSLKRRLASRFPRRAFSRRCPAS
jgi:hypothetical protein